MQRFKLQPLKDKWSTLSPREQQAVAIGSVVVVIFIIYQFFWSPLNDYAVSLRKQLTTQQSTLSWMKAADQHIQSLSHNNQAEAKALTPVALLTQLQVEVSKKGLSNEMADLKQISNDTVEIRFQKAPFDQLVKLMMSVVAGQRLTITRMSVNYEGSPGIVSADITLKIG